MPILAFDPGSEEPAAPQTPPQKTSGVLALDIPEASYGQVIKDVPEKVGLQFIQSGAGLTRGLADLLGMDSLAEVSAEVARNANSAADALTPGEMTLGQKVLSGGAESALQMLPAIATGGTSLLAPAIGIAAATQGGQRYSELRDAGFSGGRAGFHAAVDALAEGLGEYVALPVLAQTTRPFLNKLVEFAARDLVGEEFTTVMEQANAMLSDKPNMTWGDFLEGMKMTALVTPVAAGFQVAGAHAVDRIKAAAAPREAGPSFQDPKIDHPAPVPEEVPPKIPPAQGVTAPDPAVLVETPPEKPAATSTAPKDSFTPPSGWNTHTSADGQVDYVHGETKAIIEKNLDGWRLIAPWDESSPEPDSVGSFKTLEDAFKAAENYGWSAPKDQIPHGWQRMEDGTFRYYLSGEPDNYFRIMGRPGKWTLLGPPDGNFDPRETRTASVLDAAKSFAGAILYYMQNGRGQETTEPTAPQPPVPNARPVNPQPDTSTILATDATPEQMTSLGKFDPRLYIGMRAQPPGQSRPNSQITDVVRREDGTYDITYKGPLGGDATIPAINGSSALEKLSRWTGVDIRTNPDALNRLYTDHIFGRLANGDVAPSELSPEVIKYFGSENLAKISAGGLEQYRNIGMRPNSFNTGRGTAYNQGRGNDTLGYDVTGPDGKSYATRSIKMRDMDAALPPGVYTDPRTATPIGKKVAAFIERLRKSFTPNLRIILEGPDLAALINGGVPGVGSSSRSVGNIAFIHANGLDRGPRGRPLTAVELSRIMQTAAHEFGHQLINEHFYTTASPQTRAKIFASYFEYVKNVKGDSAMLNYLLEHHFSPRSLEDAPAEVQDMSIKKFREYREGTDAFTKYVMGIDEYLADQAAAYFIEREGTRSNDKEVRGYFENLLATLKALWEKVKTSFKPNTTYHDWIESLAGPEWKAGSTGPETRGPGPNLGPQTPPKPNSTPIGTREQADALLKKAGLLMDALHRAGATKEEVDALSPTGLIADINWDAAGALADKYGIPRSIWNDRYSPFQVDDTMEFRQQLYRMSTKMALFDDRAEIAKTNAAIKGFNWLLQRTMTAVQLRKRFGDAIPGVKNFVDSLEKMFAYRSRWKERADTRIKDMRGVGHGERGRVFDLLLEEDKSGEFAAKLDRDIAGKRTYALSEEAIKKYKLSEAGVALYRTIREDFDAALEELEFQADAELRRLYSPGEALTKALAELHDGFAQMKARPYVPHTRFGDHTITVRTPAGAVREFYQFESEREAKAEEKRLRAEYGNSAVVSRGKMTEIQRAMVGLPPQLINAMKAQLQLSPEQIGKFEDLLKDMSNGAAFVRRFKRRKNIEGWADDAEQFPRAYADYMSRFANHVSRLKYNHVLSEATGAVRSQAVDESKVGLNTVELNDLATWLGKLQEYVNAPGTEYANARAAATIWYLGLNTKSALVNSTSVPMVTLPFLSKRFGWTRAFDSVTQAYKDIARQYVKVNALTPDERKMLQSLREAGRIDASFASELAGLREGGRLSDQTALSKPAAAFFGMKYYAMWLFQKVEVINREVTALAAYRLHRTQRNFAEDDPHGFDQRAAEQASRTVQDTQSENAQWNRSEFMRGRKSILTMFMSYQQNIVYQMLGGDQAWMRLLAAQLTMAGLMGIPFAQDIDDLIKWFARKVFGSDINVEKAVRAILQDTGVNADWFLHGVANNMGGIDLAGSLSQGRVIPGVQALAMEGSFPDRMANAAGDVGGAGFSILLNAMKAAASNDPDTWKKWSRMMPEFARSVVEGGEMFSGAARDSRGAKIADTSTGNAFMRSLGFQISDVANEREKRFAQRDTAQYWLTRRAYVLALWDKAATDREGNWREKAREALTEFNNEAPDRALRITSDQLRESIKRRAMGQVRDERNLGPSKTVQQTYSRVGSLYE